MSRRRSSLPPSHTRRTETVRVVLADPHPLFRDALARTVSNDRQLELVGQFDDAAQLADAVRRLWPRVAVADAGLIEPTTRWRREHTRLLLLATDVTASDAYAAVERGAAGYLSKDADGAVIRRAIFAVARGETVLDPSAQTGIAQEIRLRARDDRPELSAREREILGLIAGGKTAPQIAANLHLSTATVKTHLLHLYDKLGVTERAAAVAEAMRRGLLE